MFCLNIDKSFEVKVDALIRVTVPDDKRTEARATLTTIAGGITHTHTGASKIMYTLPADKQVELRISYVDANGNPASVDGAVQWQSSDEDIARIEPLTATPVAPGDAPGSHVVMVPGTKVGVCQISAQADADLGEGVNHLTTLLDVTVVGGEAVSGTIEPVGEPMDRPS